MDPLSLFVGLIIIILLVRMLHLTATAEEPKLFLKTPISPFLVNLLELCPILTSAYYPTSLWGKSGHFQTVVHAKMGRTKPKRTTSQRFHVPMPDGATMSYDVFNPKEDGTKAKFTLAICPGIANTSECIYISYFSAYAQSHGYRVAVLNHLGSLKGEKLTSPRIFTYGGTAEYTCMIEKLLQQYPDTKILAIGFSMGGNIVTKFLGENRENQSKVLCGASICQGYEASRTRDHFKEWSQLRRFYVFAMTLKQRNLLKRHRENLFNENTKQTHKQIDEKKVFRATDLETIDKNLGCYLAGFSDVEEYYHWSSCAYTMQNISIPMLFMNAEDDPLIPHPLLEYPKISAEKNENCIFVTTKHGGHLGFFEGGCFIPNEVTWLDRFVVEYADAIVSLYHQGKLPLIEKMSLNTQTQDPSDKEESEIYESKSYKSSNGGAVKTTPYRRNNAKETDSTSKEEEKRGSLKRGSILKKATPYVQ